VNLSSYNQLINFLIKLDVQSKKCIPKRLAFDASKRIFSRARPFIESHRGCSKDEPENTLPAFQKAIDIGCDSVELDVWLTKDKVPVVIHGKDNGEIHETTNGQGIVNELTFRELSSFSSIIKNEAIPTLEDVLLICKERIFVNIEIKDGQFSECLDQVLSLVKIHNMITQVAISSFKHEYYHEIKKRCETESIEFGFLYETTHGEVCDFKIHEEIKNNTLNVWYKEVNPELVEKAHKNNIAVHCWFCMKDDETEDVFKYLMDCGVDVICCNNPVLALKVREDIYGK
jgi:glycerophosphoryl diester phosphodiesterase